MSLFTLMNICMISFAFILIFQILVDFKDFRLSQKIKKHQKFQDELLISVVMEFDGSPNRLMQIINNILYQDYNSLEMIFLVKPSDVDMMKKIIKPSNKKLCIKIISYRKNQKLTNTIKRHCKGSLVVSLNQNDELSRSFFRLINREAQFKSSQDIFIPIHKFHINDTLSSLFFTQFETFKRFWINLIGVGVDLSQIHSGFVYRRGIKLVDKISRIQISRSAYISKASPFIDMFSYLNFRIDRACELFERKAYLVILIAIILLSYLLGVFVGINLILYVICIVICVYLLVNVILQFKSNGRSLAGRINLILVAPLTCVVDFFVTVMGVLKLVVTLFRQRIR